MRFIRLLAIGLALVVSSGCASEPTLERAATELQKDMQRLEADDVFKSPSKKLRILQLPDKDIPCDKDKYKRVLRATADYERKSSDVDGHLDLAQGLMETRLCKCSAISLILISAKRMQRMGGSSTARRGIRRSR